MWNALPLHPMKPGIAHSNRSPTEAELEIGKPGLQLLLAAFPSTPIVAVGKNASKSLSDLGIAHVAIRHPANGGATEFARGLAHVIDSL